MIRSADLRFHGTGTVTVTDAVPRSGELAAFCRPVVTAPVLVKRDGTVLADGWLPDFVRLGELEPHLGDGVIEAVVDAALQAGRLKRRQRRRIMSSLFWQAAGPLIGDGEPSAVMLAGMPVGAADGMLVSLADTPENRAFFGSTGTADDSSPFPQLRIIAVTARAGRATLGAILGQAGTGEQTLLKRLVRRRPELFRGLVVCFDRNFPGHDLILAILQAGGHVVARVKEGIALPFAGGPDGGWLPDGSRMTWLNAPSGRKADRLPVRAAEHNAALPGGDGTQVPETCTIITTLPGHLAAPADAVRDAYMTRWSASETTFGEDKSAIAGAGNRTSGPVLRSGRPRLVIQEAWVRHEAHCRIAR